MGSFGRYSSLSQIRPEESVRFTARASQPDQSGWNVAIPRATGVGKHAFSLGL